MSREASRVTVRAIRPHDTAEGFKEPGAEYERDAKEAEQLKAAGVLSIVTRKAK